MLLVLFSDGECIAAQYLTACSTNARETFCNGKVSKNHIRSSVFTRKECQCQSLLEQKFPRKHVLAMDSAVLSIEAEMPGRELHECI